MQYSTEDLHKLKETCLNGTDEDVRSIVSKDLLQSLLAEIERLGELAIDAEGEMCSLHRKIATPQSERTINLYGDHESITLAGRALDSWLEAEGQATVTP